MKNTKLTKSFIASLLVASYLLPSTASANEIKKEATSATSNTTEVTSQAKTGNITIKNSDGTTTLAEIKPETTTVEKNKPRGLLAEMFPEIGIRYWKPTITGNVKVNGNNRVGTDINLHDDLNLYMQDPKATDYDKIGLDNPESKFRFRFEYYKLPGGRTITRNASFQNGSYSIGDSIGSELRIKYLTVKWLPTYTPEGDDTSSVVVQLVYYGNKQRMKLSPYEEVSDFEGYLPALGYRIERGRTTDTMYYGEFTANPTKNYYYNVEAGAVKRFGKLALGAGYRICAQKMTSGDDYLQYKASGPFFQAMYKF